MKESSVCVPFCHEGRKDKSVPSRVLLTTMCAGDGDLASLSACLL